MKLIVEQLLAESKVESVDGQKKYYIEGIFLQGDIKNANGRVYPKTVLESAVNKYMPIIKANRSLGELNHPPTPQINFERACIKTIELREDGSNFIGKALVLSTPLGELCKRLLDDGVSLGVSSRGLGSIVENAKGEDVVQSDYEIAAAADVVSAPSAPDAYVRGIMESTAWEKISDSAYVQKHIEETKQLGKISAKQLQEQKEILFAKFIKALER